MHGTSDEWCGVQVVGAREKRGQVTVRSEMPRYPVYLNVYDMYWVNDYLSNLGIGVYHTGVEVHDWEYGYGGHPLSFSGVFQIIPKDGEELGENYKFKQSILLGYTELNPEDVSSIILSMGDEFKGDRYHLLTNNCNHFSAKLAEIPQFRQDETSDRLYVESPLLRAEVSDQNKIKILCGQPIPAWVNRLAYLSTVIPFLERCLPREWLTPIALQQSLDRRRTTPALRTNCQRGGDAAQSTTAGHTGSVSSSHVTNSRPSFSSTRSLFHFTSSR